MVWVCEHQRCLRKGWNLFAGFLFTLTIGWCWWKVFELSEQQASYSIIFSGYDDVTLTWKNGWIEIESWETLDQWIHLGSKSLNSEKIQLFWLPKKNGDSSHQGAKNGRKPLNWCPHHLITPSSQVIPWPMEIIIQPMGQIILHIKSWWKPLLYHCKCIPGY